MLKKLTLIACLLGMLLFAATAEAAVEFTDSEVPVSGGKPLDVAVGNVDGVNGPDLVASINQAGTTSLAVRLNNGDGTFAPEQLYPLGCVAEQVELTDLGGTNGDNTPDGALDAAVFCVGGGYGGYIGRVAGDGTGAFLGPGTFPPALVAGTGDQLGTEGGFQRMALAQIRAPGLPLAPMWTYNYNPCGFGPPCYLNTICMSYDWSSVTCFSPVDGYPKFYPPVASGAVADARVFGTGTPESPGVADTRRLVAFGDFPGAGAPAGTVIDGTERDFGPSPGTQLPAWKSITIGDLAGDGPDILTAEGVCGCSGSGAAPAGRVSVLPGNLADGVVPNVTPVTFQSAPGVLSIAVGDIDLDGKQDVIGLSYTNSGNSVFVQLGDGAGGLASPVTTPVSHPNAAYSRAPIQLADFDRNGSLDAVVITDAIQVLKNGSSPPPPPLPPPNPNPINPFAGLSGLKASAKVDSKGFTTVGTATNPPTSSVDLTITSSGGKGHAKPKVIGQAKVTIPAGGSAPLKVKLKSKARKQLKHGKLKATLTLVAVATDGTTDTKTQALKLKPAKK